MNRISLKMLSVVAVATLVLTGCVSSPKSFPDPSYPKISYEEIKRARDPARLKLTTEFKRDGNNYEKGDKILYQHVERVLRGTGVVIPSSKGEDGTIHVEVNNLVDTGKGVAKGIGNGLTLGMVGTTLTDRYLIKITIVNNGKTIERSGIQHQLHTTLGNASVPEGVEYYSIPNAFEKMVEQVLLKTLSDMQKSGEISMSLDFLKKMSVA